MPDGQTSNSRLHPAVVRPPDHEAELAEQSSPESGLSMRVAIDRASTGCRNLEQRVLRYGPGAEHVVHHPGSEDVSYILSGTGLATMSGVDIPLSAGTGLLIPEDMFCEIVTTAEQPLVVLSVLAPQPGASTGPPAAEAVGGSSFAVHQSEQETIPAGDDEARGRMDRHFKLLIDPARGARYVTQFLGFIERSRAPFHTHTYEEVIYIIDGHGVVHLEGGAQEIGPGTSVYLPAGVQHCLENPGEQPLSLVGVFCPAGSPAARQPAATAR